MPIATIGLPFFNNRDYLTDTIRSVFAQTIQDWELILMDDGSTDGSLELARSIIDPRVRVFSDGVNRGLAWRLNEIAAQARGQICFRLDSDDLMHPSRLARVMDYFNDHPSTDAVFSAAYVMDERCRITAHLPVVERRTIQDILRKSFSCHPTMAARAAWARGNSYPTRTRRAEDLDMWCKCFSSTTFGYIPETLYYSRLVSDYSLRKYAATANDHCKIIISYGPELLGLPATALLLAKAQLKVAVHLAASIVGMNPPSTRRSLSAVSPELKAREAKTIAAILDTAVPFKSSPNLDICLETIGHA